MTHNSETYNGWTNYETWRVNLEMFDGYETDYPVTANSCEEMAQDLICDSTQNGFVRGLALAFLADVDWDSIADHINDANDLTASAERLAARD